MKHTIVPAAAFVLTSYAAQSPGADQFPPEQIEKGAETFAAFCTPCHGERMSNPEFFNLKTFPPDQRSRFVNSVTNGKNAMPPWRGQLTPEDIEALWSYVVAGERGK
jgi:mono/diheme cytochrome c family protein